MSTYLFGVIKTGPSCHFPSFLSVMVEF